LNSDYVNIILNLTPAETISLSKKNNETNETYIQRFHHDEAALHERCYTRIKCEMGIPSKKLSQQGMFSRAASHSASSAHEIEPSQRRFQKL
jgi:hypothetical protein